MSSLTRALIVLVIAIAAGIGLVFWQSQVGHGASVVITPEDMQTLLEDAPPQALAQLAASEEARQLYAERVKTELALAEEARARGIAAQPEVRRQLELQRAQILAAAYIQNQQAGGAPVTPDSLVSDEEINRFFQNKTNEIKLEKLLADIKKLGGPTLDEEQLKEARKEYARLIILAEKAEAANIDDRREVQLQITYQQARALIQFLGRDEELRKELEPTEEEVNAYLAENPELDEAGARAKAQEIYQRIQRGEDFTALARKYSSDTSKFKGGDLGYFTRGRMVPEFENAAFGLQRGQVSEPVKSDFGFHIIKVTDKRARAVEGQQVEEVRASHILIPISAGQPENPMMAMAQQDPRERARAELSREKQQAFLERLKEDSRVQVAENFTVPEPQFRNPIQPPPPVAPEPSEVAPPQP